MDSRSRQVMNHNSRKDSNDKLIGIQRNDKNLHTMELPHKTTN